MKLIGGLIIFCILLFSGCLCLRVKNNSLVPINLNDVSFISVTKGVDKDTICVLNSKQTAEFISMFNSAKCKGYYKMITHYVVKINLMNDSTRTFAINGKLIKEVNDLAFSLMSNSYIENIYSNSSKLMLQLDHPVKYPFYKVDGFAFKAELDYKDGIRNYYFTGFIESSDFLLFYEEYLKLYFNIELKYSCSHSYMDDVYYSSMNHEVVKEFGADFIERTTKEVQQLTLNAR